MLGSFQLMSEMLTQTSGCGYSSSCSIHSGTPAEAPAMAQTSGKLLSRAAHPFSSICIEKPTLTPAGGLMKKQ